ncbi:hypothetical protein [Nocardioides acrostichi]|uniref:Uncharacterized protein n=1 Tax=Nocardioides acrostichi TaxID=2784339 RepID=A0A930YDK1_9ACTN|nr:hypothetical protein [Nocardioides acrostichi]MBF4162549.1 hypothetical protein [Nocardioides acrostichi]
MEIVIGVVAVSWLAVSVPLAIAFGRAFRDGGESPAPVESPEATAA